MPDRKFFSEQFSWRNGRGMGQSDELGISTWPHEFTVVSHRTGRELTFRQDRKTNLDNEFFDGEGCAFLSVDDRVKIQIWRA